MPRLILDKWTSMPISPARRHQMRKQEAGRCKICSAKAVRGKLLCRAHQEAAAAHMRLKRSPAFDLI